MHLLFPSDYKQTLIFIKILLSVHMNPFSSFLLIPGCYINRQQKKSSISLKRRKTLLTRYHSNSYQKSMLLYQVRIFIDTLLFVNGQAPAPPTWFSEQLKDEFASVPLLFHTTQQLSASFPDTTNSYQRICIFACWM